MFEVGQPVTWHYTPRGGYGYTVPVDATVTKIGPRRVQIEALSQWTRAMKRVWVDPANLSARKQD